MLLIGGTLDTLRMISMRLTMFPLEASTTDKTLYQCSKCVLFFNIKSCQLLAQELESLYKMKFKVNNDINSKVSLCQGDITKINDDATVYATSETVISEFGINGAIHEATGIVT